MAWVTGQHAEAPQGVLCFAGPDPGTVIWYEPGEAPASDTPPVNTDVPHATQSGTTLNCTMGIWEGTPTSYAYQWRVDGADVGADSPDYTRNTGDVGKVANCVVTATNANGSTAAPPSNDVVVE